MAPRTTPTTRPGSAPPAGSGTPAADAVKGLGIPSTTAPSAPTQSSAGYKPSTAASSLTLTQTEGDQSGIANYDKFTLARRSQNVPLDTYAMDPGLYGQSTGTETGHVTTLGAERSRLYTMSPDELRDTQARMAAAGFYGQADAHGNFGYTPGIRDGKTVTAFNNWLLTSAREYSARGVDADTVLDEAAAAHNASGDLKNKTGTAGAVRTLQIDLSDPHEMSVLADTVGQAVLGRATTTAEKAAITARVQQLQLARGGAIQAAEQSAANATTAADNVAKDAGGLAESTPDTVSTVPVTNVNPQAVTDDMLREMHPGEAGAHDYDQGIQSALAFITRSKP